LAALFFNIFAVVDGPEASVSGLFAHRHEAHEGRRGIGHVKARRGKPLEG
jgi:hypothetical protein